MRAAVIGAGIIGLACAEELIRAGHDVRVFDPTPAGGATHAAAGMLAPAGEAWHGEGPLLRLGLASAVQWPGYAARLREQSGIDVDFRTSGTLLVGWDHDDLQVVRRTLELLESQGIPFEHLDRRGLLRQEPTLSSRVAGGALLPDDHNVNPRKAAEALMRIIDDRLVRRAASATGEGVVLEDGTIIAADAVVIATGADSGAVRETRYVRPVKGEIVRARMDDPPGRVVRARVYSGAVYIVPRADNEVVIGATEEEHSGDPIPTVGGVTRLLNAARALVPGLETAEILDITARHRPGTPDNGPVLGPVVGPATQCRHIIATGHYRSGVLLAPLTAQVVRAHVEGTAVPEEALPFLPDRFSGRSETTPQIRNGGARIA